MPLARLSRRVRRWARGRVFAVARGRRAFLTVRVHGCLYVVATADRGVSEKIYVRRRRPEFAVLERALGLIGAVPADATFVDVGANIGTTTIPALMRHGFARAVACEPGPLGAEALRRSVAANGLDDRVTVVEAAVSDREGTISVRIGTDDSGVLEVAGAAGEELDVESVTLDGLAERGVYDGSRVGLLWVDAQGHEGHVLAGAGRLLGRGVPLVVALRPKKLRRGDGLDRFVELLTTHYRQVADLRSVEPIVEPVAALRRYIDENRKTDLLFLPD